MSAYIKNTNLSRETHCPKGMLLARAEQNSRTLSCLNPHTADTGTSKQPPISAARSHRLPTAPRYPSALAVTMSFTNFELSYQLTRTYTLPELQNHLNFATVKITRFLVAIVNANNGLRKSKSISWDNRLPLANQLQART